MFIRWEKDCEKEIPQTIKLCLSLERFPDYIIHNPLHYTQSKVILPLLHVKLQSILKMLRKFCVRRETHSSAIAKVNGTHVLWQTLGILRRDTSWVMHRRQTKLSHFRNGLSFYGWDTFLSLMIKCEMLVACISVCHLSSGHNLAYVRDGTYVVRRTRLGARRLA